MNEVPVSEVLEKAKELINTPHKWARGGYAYCGMRHVSFEYPNANRFCSIGAIKRASLELDVQPYQAQSRLDETSFDLSGYCTITFNDTKNHRDVMRLFDEAIRQALQAEGKFCILGSKERKNEA